MRTPLHFKTNTLLKNLVGKDLINDDNIAIVELVKNSYDASSRSVLIDFQEAVDAAPSRLVIVDQGKGMDKDDIKEKWLNIAYSDKKTSNPKPGHFLAGNKGVGRFSCDRLGQKLDLFTRKGSGELLHLNIDWKDFEVEDRKDLTIQEIKVYLNNVTPSEVKKLAGVDMHSSGTVLLISNLRSVWGRKKLLDLKYQLEKFINPNQFFQKEIFKIELKAIYLLDSDVGKAYHEQVNGVVQNSIFESLKFKATYIDSRIVDSGKTIETELYHEGNLVFRLKEKNSDSSKLQNVRSVIYFLNQYKKSFFKRQTGIRLIDFGSIFLFLNGFRIAPYGERGDDWLGIDVRKTQGTARFLGNRDIVGRVEITDLKNEFQPISSREGLKNTESFSELKDHYFKNVLRRLERFVVDGLNWDSVSPHLRGELQDSEGLDWEETSERYSESWDKKRNRISKSIMPIIGLSKDKVISFWFNPSLLEGLVGQKSKEIEKIVSDIGAFDGDVVDSSLKKKLKQFAKIISEKNTEIISAKQKVIDLETDIEDKKETIKKLETRSASYQAQTLFLKSVSSLDEKTLLGFHHQICLDATIVNNYIERAIKALRDEENINVALKHLEKISKANKKIMTTAQYATKANFKSGSKKELTDLPAYFEQYLNTVTKEFVASNLRLSVENKVFEAFEIETKRIELSILIDNIVSNSDKAHATKLHVGIEMNGKNSLAISFVDDGSGLDQSVDIASLFDLGVTSTKGSGLGLYHAKQIIDSLGAEIQFVRRKPKGAEIRMVFTR